MGKQSKLKKIYELKITMSKLKNMMAKMIKKQSELISLLKNNPSKK